MTTSSPSFSNQDALIRGCYTLAARLRRLHWPVVLFIFMALVMLISFYLVVSDGVQVSQQRVLAAAALEKANMRCKSMGGRTARDDCFQQIKIGAMAQNEPLL